MAVESPARRFDDEETWRERWLAKGVAVVVVIALAVALLLVVRQLTTPRPTPPRDAYVNAHHGRDVYQGAFLGVPEGPCLDCTGFGSMVLVQYHGLEWQCWSGISETGREWECEPH